MKYIIMCAGNGKRWGNYLGIPKHFVKINNETLIGRTTRLLKENGITNYIITTDDERYKQYGEIKTQSYNDCEVDRFEETDDKEICYLYGDVYYTEEALKTIINTEADDILFFGSEMEIVAVKVKNKELFIEHKNKVKQLYLENKITRCIGWEVYKSINNLPLEEYAITDRFYLIDDGTDDIDCPKNYWEFVYKFEGGNNMIKCEAIRDFSLGRFKEIENIERLNAEKNEEGQVYKGDIIYCKKDLADYLYGDNDDKIVAIRILEVIPEETKEPVKEKKTTKKRKTSKK